MKDQSRSKTGESGVRDGADERGDWTGAMLGRRERIGFGDVGDVVDLSGLQADSGIIRDRVIGIEHG